MKLLQILAEQLRLLAKHLCAICVLSHPFLLFLLLAVTVLRKLLMRKKQYVFSVASLGYADMHFMLINNHKIP
jgi:hypothetical protein